MTNRKCPKCNGTGYVEYERVIGGYDPDVWQGYRDTRRECDRCYGAGELDNRKPYSWHDDQ